MANRLAPGDHDRPAKTLRPFTKGCVERASFRALYGEEALFVDGGPDSPDVGVPTQDGDDVGFAGRLSFCFTDKAVETKPDPGGGVFHPLRVLQNSKTLMCVLHGLSPRAGNAVQ